jgi:hypothetical protein
MASNKNQIAIVVIVLFATSLLISSLDYSSGIIGSGGVPESSYSYVGNGDTSANHTPGNACGDAHPAEKNGGNASDPWGGLFLNDRGNGSSSADVRDSGNTLLIIGLIAAAITVIAVVAFIIIRRRRNAHRMSSLPTATAPVLPALVPDWYEGLFQLQFPQIRAPFPLIWGAGEPLELVIASKDKAIGEAMLRIDGGEVRNVLLENGMATVLLKLNKGDHKVTVTAMPGVYPPGNSRTSVSIVDYREEIVRMFNDMCRRFTSADDLTPRELERSLGKEMSETKQRLLGAVVTTFEQANYSLHEIRRADFECMYTSEMGVL